MRRSPLETVHSLNSEWLGRFHWMVRSLVLVTVITTIVGIAGCGGDKEEAAPSVGNEALVPDGISTSADGDTLSGNESGMGSGVDSDLQEGGNPVPAGSVGSGGTVLDTGSDPTEMDAQPADTGSTGDTNDTGARDPASTIAGGRYSLQLGSFQKLSFAEERSRQIRTAGLEPVIEAVSLSGVTYHRVLVRGISDRETALAIGEDLRSRLNVAYLIKRAD